ncbi:MAG: hypothetical protein Q9225_001373 [Loekoesia sp. 1 TL-2023]
MAFSINLNRPLYGNAPLTENHPAFERLQSLEGDPELLARERSQRYSGDPPSYSNAASTTEPSTPIRLERHIFPALVPHESLPSQQFQNQAIREKDQILRQIGIEYRPRNQTLHFDEELDFRANAENNVRNDWVKQRIWKAEWGPAWLKGADPGDNRWFYSSQRTPGPSPFGLWSHEIEQELLPPSPEPTPESPQNLFAPQKPRVAPKRETVGPEIRVSASRPTNQFRYQVAKETRWLTDEPRYQNASVDEIEAQAYTNVKNAWKRWRIWMEEWGPIPGSAWAHEKPRKSPETHGGEADTTNHGKANNDHPTPPLDHSNAHPGNNAADNLPTSASTQDAPEADTGGGITGPLPVSMPGFVPSSTEVPQQQQHPTSETDGETGLRPPVQNGNSDTRDQKQTRPRRRSARIKAQPDDPEQNLSKLRTSKRKRGIESQKPDTGPKSSTAKRRKSSTQGKNKKGRRTGRS